ncbi:MAG: hypothetical protein ACP5R4_10780 [Armatimonadota bacterium]
MRKPLSQIESSTPSPWPRRVTGFLAVWMLVVSGSVLAAVWSDPIKRAVVGMAWGLILLWVGGCGLTMRRWADPLNRAVSRVPLPWSLKFVLGCTILACTEEAVTTLMTNCAPLFGVRIGQAYITASASYLDVILYHSVVVFVPMFIGWALLLRWWRFSPFAVFLLFGTTGLLAETMSFGPQNLGNFAMWIFVYGLMVWLPAHWAPNDRPARKPAWWTYPLAVVFPMLMLPLNFVLAPWLWLTPKHPPIHFAPIPN